MAISKSITNCINCHTEGEVQLTNTYYIVCLPADWYWLDVQIGKMDNFRMPYCGECARTTNITPPREKWWTGDMSHVLDFIPAKLTTGCQCSGKDLFNFGCRCPK